MGNQKHKTPKTDKTMNAAAGSPAYDGATTRAVLETISGERLAAARDLEAKKAAREARERSWNDKFTPLARTAADAELAAKAHERAKQHLSPKQFDEIKRDLEKAKTKAVQKRDSMRETAMKDTAPLTKAEQDAHRKTAELSNDWGFWTKVADRLGLDYAELWKPEDGLTVAAEEADEDDADAPTADAPVAAEA